MNKISVTIPWEMMETLWKIAKERIDIKRGTPALANSHTYGDHSEYTANFMGLMGEYAFSVYSKSSVDFTNHLHGDRGKDFVIHNQTVDIKTTKFSRLVFSPGEFKSDIAVLAQVYLLPTGKLSNKVCLMGWITRLNFLEKCGVENLSYGDRQIITIDQLRAMDELEGWTKYMTY